MGANETFVFTNVRILYPSILRPTKNYSGDGNEYSLVILIPKTDSDQINRFGQVYQKLATAEFKTVPGNLRPFLGNANQKAVVKDGDDYYNYAEAEKKAKREVFRGNYYMNLAIDVNRGRVDAVDANQQPIISADQLPSGSYGHVVAECSCYKSPKFGPNFTVQPRLVQVLDISQPIGAVRMDVETACSLLPGAGAAVPVPGSPAPAVVNPAGAAGGVAIPAVPGATPAVPVQPVGVPVNQTPAPAGNPPPQNTLAGMNLTDPAEGLI